jgi:hypothetical protein
MGNDFCGNPTYFKEEDSCQKVIDQMGLRKHFDENCF